MSESHLDSLLDNTTSTLALLSTLSDSFKAVEAQMTAFEKQCEGLLADQKRLTKLADDIADNVQYYTYLEPATRRLNAPGAGNFVRGKDFSEMLLNLDSCLDYLKSHVCTLQSSHNEMKTYVAAAKSKRGGFISLSLSLAAHKSTHFDTNSFYQFTSRNCGRRC